MRISINKQKDLLYLRRMELAKHLYEKVKQTKKRTNHNNQTWLANLKKFDADDLYHYYNKDELIAFVLKLDSEFKIECDRKSDEELEFSSLEENICVICRDKKEPDSLEENIKVCIECFNSSSKKILAQYLIYSLQDRKDKDLSLFLGKLKTKSLDQLCKEFTQDELKDIISELYMVEDVSEEENIIIDYASILEEYSKMNIERLTNSDKLGREDEIWRQHVPAYLKRKFRDWNTASIEEVYEATNRIISEYGVKAYDELMGFSSELSQIIFETNDEEEDEISDISSEVEAYIMYIVEMIILPHLEVLDRIKEAKGNIHFVNINDQHFSESLKKEAKDRDGWKCVICKNDTNLHVHHRIPRKYGGINHIDNLVTLCSSCHGAVETANVQVAFKKGISNYRQTLGRGLEPEQITHDKDKLKEEIENTLDKILARTMNRGDIILSEQIVNVMDKLKIVFYE